MKQFKTHEIRNLLDQVTRGDISFSRMVELINEEIDKHSVSMVDRDVDYEKEMPHKEWPSTKYVARKVDAEPHDRHISGWTHVSAALPERLETVWLSNGKGFTTLGCLVWTEDGWHWAATNGVIYEENGRIVSECESDDIDAEYWHRLPDALRIDKEVKP